MAAARFIERLNEQIGYEFAASQQYVAAAVYYDAETLPRLAAFFYRQALEEREHAMMMIRYLLDVGEEVQIPDIRSQPTTYADGSEPVKMALEQEKRVSDEIFSLFELARDLKSTADALTKKINELDNKTADAQSELRKDMLAETRKLMDELRKRSDDITALLERRSNELRADKADRSLIAALLADMAMQISGEPEGKKKVAKAGRDD